MNNKTMIGFLIILVAAIFGALAFVIWPALNFLDRQVSSQPDQVVQDFYDWYLSYEGNPLVDGAYRASKLLSPDFIAFLDDFTGQEGIAYDPVLCAQDVPSDISTSPAEVQGGEANVQVSTSFANNSFTVELVQTDGTWLIDEVDCEVGNQRTH